MERRLKQKSGIPKDLDLNDEEAMDYWAASRLLKRPEAVMEQVLLASNFWDVIFKTIPEWSDMVRKCTFKTEQHVYDFKKMILSLSLYLQMVLFISEQLHFRVGEFLDERPACGPKYKAIWIPTSPLDSSEKRSDRGTSLRARRPTVQVDVHVLHTRSHSVNSEGTRG